MLLTNGHVKQAQQKKPPKSLNQKKEKCREKSPQSTFDVCAFSLCQCQHCSCLTRLQSEPPFVNFGTFVTYKFCYLLFLVLLFLIICGSFVTYHFWYIILLLLLSMLVLDAVAKPNQSHHLLLLLPLLLVICVTYYFCYILLLLLSIFSARVRRGCKTESEPPFVTFALSLVQIDICGERLTGHCSRNYLRKSAKKQTKNVFQ